MNKKTYFKSLAIPYYIILILLIVFPMFIMFLYSFQIDNHTTHFSLQFTFDNYSQFFKEPAFIKSMSKSIYIAIISTFLCLLIGYPIAYLITKLNNKRRALVLSLITSPMWINMLLRTLSLKQIFELINPSFLGSNSAVIFGIVYLYIPFMIIPIFTVLSKLDLSLVDAARDLGANNFLIFLKVILPLSINGIISGVLMVLLPATTTIIVPNYLGGGMYLIGNLIEEYATKSNRYGFSSAIATILAIIMICLIGIFSKRKKKGIKENANI